jgi:MscS family membrane protein
MKYKYTFLLLFILFFSSILKVQNTSYSLISPQQTMRTHLSNLEDGNYKPEISSKVFNPNRVDSADAEKLATQLLQIYIGAGILIDYDDIPSDPNYIDSLSGNHVYVIDKKVSKNLPGKRR